MNKTLLAALLAMLLPVAVSAQSKQVRMQAKSSSGKQVALPSSGKKADAVVGQTTMLVDGMIYPLLGFSFLSCEGDSATGTVRVSVEARAKAEPVTLRFGIGCGDDPCLRAVDARGNLFEGAFADENPDATLTPDEPARYVFVFDDVPVGLEMFKFVKAEYEIRCGDEVYSSQAFNPIGVKHARIEWKNL